MEQPTSGVDPSADEVPDEEPAILVTPFDVIEREARRGRILSAALMVVAAPPEADRAVATVVAALDADGLAVEAAVLRSCLRSRWIPAIALRSRRAGTIAALIVGLGLAPFVGLLAILPAIGALFLVRETAFAFVGRSAQVRLPDDDRRSLRTLADVAFYRSPSLRVTPLGAVLIGVLGVLAYSGAVQLRVNGGSEPATLALAITGTASLASAALAWRGSRRLHAIGLDLDRPVSGRGEQTTAVLGPTPVLTEPIYLPQPRQGMVTGVFFASICCLIVGIATRDLIPIGVGLATAAVGALLEVRMKRTEIVIGPDGIVEVRLFRTRRYEWHQIHALSEHEPNRPGLTLIEANGRRRELATYGAGLTRTQMTTIVELSTALATAPDPGPDPSDRRFRLIIAIFLGVVVLFLTGLVLAFALAGSTRSVDPATVPADRTVWFRQRADGTEAHWIECPSVGAAVAGEHDPLCQEAVRVNALVMLGFLAFDIAMVVAIVALTRRRGAAMVDR